MALSDCIVQRCMAETLEEVEESAVVSNSIGHS